MKTWNLFGLTLGLSAVALAGPLQPAHIAADARWVIHLDLEALLATTVGQTLARESLDPHLAKPTADLKRFLDFDFDWRRIRSISVYGAEFGGPPQLRGVMLVDTDMDIAAGFEAALRKQAEWGRAADGDLQRLDADGYPLYAVKEVLYVSAQPGAPVVLGQTRRTTLRAREVLVGGAPNLNTAPGFLAFIQGCSPGFLVAAAEGFRDQIPVPPQAQVLKMTEALRLTLEEADNRLHAHLALNAQSAEVAQQIHHVVQGMLALVALTQAQNEELQTLARGLQVALDGRQINLRLSLPADLVAGKITEGERQKRARQSTAP